MVNKEAHTKTTRAASPAAIPYSKGETAKQAAAVKGKMNGAYAPPCDSRRLFRFMADKAVKPKSA